MYPESGDPKHPESWGYTHLEEIDYVNEDENKFARKLIDLEYFAILIWCYSSISMVIPESISYWKNIEDLEELIRLGCFKMNERQLSAAIYIRSQWQEENSKAHQATIKRCKNGGIKGGKTKSDAVSEMTTKIVKLYESSDLPERERAGAIATKLAISSKTVRTHLKKSCIRK